MEIGSNIQGFQAAERSLANRGDRIARATARAADSSTPPTGSEPDITADVVGLATDRLAGAYNLKAQKVRDNMMGDLLDIIR